MWVNAELACTFAVLAFHKHGVASACDPQQEVSKIRLHGHVIAKTQECITMQHTKKRRTSPKAVCAIHAKGY